MSARSKENDASAQDSTRLLDKLQSVKDVSSFDSQALIPSLPSTYSLPTAPYRPLSPHGEFVLSSDTEDSYIFCNSMPKDRSHYLEKARKLLSEAVINDDLAGNFTAYPCCKPGYRNQTVHSLFSGEAYAVKFVWSHPANRSVFLAGDFNDWGLPISMTRRANGHHSETAYLWETVLRLPVGRYHYKYVVDGEWRYDSRTAWIDAADRGRVNLLIIERLDL